MRQSHCTTSPTSWQSSYRSVSRTFRALEGFRGLQRPTAGIPPGRGNMSHGIGPAVKPGGDTVSMIGRDMRDVSNLWDCTTRQKENYDTSPECSRIGNRRYGIYGRVSAVVKLLKKMLQRYSIIFARITNIHPSILENQSNHPNNIHMIFHTGSQRREAAKTKQNGRNQI